MSKIKSSRQRRKYASRRNYLSKRGKLKLVCHHHYHHLTTVIGDPCLQRAAHRA